MTKPKDKNGERFTKEELLDIVDGAIRRDMAYWAKGRYGLGVSDSDNAHWTRQIDKLEQARNQICLQYRI
jgi:hypothetical protein